MRKKSEVIEELKLLPTYNVFGTKKEISYLPEILSPDEHILSLISGFLDGNTWIITLTEKRLILLDKGMLYGLKQREIPLDKINSISQKLGLVLGWVHIQDGASGIKIDNIDKNCIPAFVDALNNAIHKYKNKSNNVSVNHTSNKRTGASEIRQYKELLDDGIITRDEFEQKKREILGL